jgi:hypothetical protein
VAGFITLTDIQQLSAEMRSDKASATGDQDALTWFEGGMPWARWCQTCPAGWSPHKRSPEDSTLSSNIVVRSERASALTPAPCRRFLVGSGTGASRYTGRTSTAAIVQWSFVGPLTEIVNGRMSIVGAWTRCTQNVSATRVSRHTWTSDWPDGTVMLAAALQSCPAAQSSEAQTLGVIVALGEPTVPAVGTAWPTECPAPRNAVTVIEPS